MDNGVDVTAPRGYNVPMPNDNRVTKGKKVRISPATDVKVTRLMRPRESYNTALDRLMDEVRDLRRDNREIRGLVDGHICENGNGKGEA